MSFVTSDIAYKNLGRVSLAHQDLTWVTEERLGSKSTLLAVALPRKKSRYCQP